MINKNSLSDNFSIVHSRFTSLKDYSKDELRELETSTAAVIGLGATGSVIAENLARHGIKLILVDRDYLEEKDVYSSNLYTPQQCEKSLPKATAAEKYLSKFTEVESHISSLGQDNLDILSGSDIILDGTDNLETRLLINEYCQKHSKPWIYTAAIAEKGYSMLFDKKCFSCYFQDADPTGLETCELAGVMRETAGQAALKSSHKAVRHLAGKNVSEVLDVLPSGETLSFEDSQCRVCQNEQYRTLNKANKTAAVCGENKYQIETDVTGLDKKLVNMADEVIADNEYLVRAVVEETEITIFSGGRIIVQARDAGHAESKVSELLGV